MKQKDAYQLYILLLGILMFLVWRGLISLNPLFFAVLFFIPLLSYKVTEIVVYPIFHLGKLLSMIQKHIFLSILYFAVVLPISLVYKLLSIDKKENITNWKNVESKGEINFKNLW
jgi:hypothetical protein